MRYKGCALNGVFVVTTTEVLGRFERVRIVNWGVEMDFRVGGTCGLRIYPCVSHVN